jgi:hypothetical protein
MTLLCSCGDTFSNEDSLNGDVIIPWFHAVAGHTLSIADAAPGENDLEVNNQPRRSHGRADGVLRERRTGDLLQ